MAIHFRFFSQSEGYNSKLMANLATVWGTTASDALSNAHTDTLQSLLTHQVARDSCGDHSIGSIDERPTHYQQYDVDG